MDARDIILKPIITERSMAQGEELIYTFKVDKNANKFQIKDAIEEIFDVKVKKVNTINVLGKIKRMGRTEGKRADWKKAIVTLKPDSKKITFFEGM